MTRIVGDSCTDFTTEEKKDEGFMEVPLTISLGDYCVRDDDNFSPQDFTQRLNATTECPKTSCPSPQDYVDAFDCDDDVFAVTLSEKLSGSYNSAVQAKNILMNEKGKKNIHIFNSCSASVGQLLVAKKIKELTSLGKNFSQIIESVNEFIKSQKTLFVLDNLDILRKNGRLNPLQAVITNVVSIKLVMCGTPDGQIAKVGQALSISKALQKLVESCEKHATDCKDKILAIAHCNCFERAEEIKNQILKKCNFKDSVIVETGGISTVYANDGGIIVSF